MFLLLAFCLLGVACGMTTHHGHHGHSNHSPHAHVTHPKPPNEQFYFHAFHDLLAIKHGHDCFLYQLNPQQQLDINTAHGLHEIEKMVIDVVDMGSPKPTVPADQAVAMEPKLKTFCGHKTVIKLN